MGKDKCKASWDASTTKVFIDLCIEQLCKGDRKGTVYTKKAWANICDGFTAKTGKVYEKMQFKNKYDSIRKEWQMWNKLINETGVGWNMEKNTVQAEDEWWEKKKLGFVVGVPFDRQRVHSEAVLVKASIDDLSRTRKLEGQQFTYWNECFTSKNVELLLKDLDINPVQSKTMLDKFAAFGILQGCLDFVNRKMMLEVDEELAK